MVRHVTRVVHPRTAFVRIAEEVCVTSPELLPHQMARVTTSLEETLLMCELCGTYAISAGYEDGMLQRRETLTTRKGLEAFLDSMGS